MSSFYSESTFLALIILSIVLIAISVLLYGIKRHLTVLNNEKNKQVAEPSLYERKFRPIIEAWNPTIATLIIAGAVMLFLGAFGYKFGMEEVGVQQGYAPTQPINFSHKIHAGQYEMDCKYCHSTVEKSKSASIPSLNTCMNCHKYVKAAEKYNGKTSPEIQKIYNAIGFDGDNMEYIEGYDQKPIEWIRIHNLPDLAYFNHSQHVVVGKVECQTCHGPIEEMEKVYQYSNLQMGWCINCHREHGIDSENNDYYEEAHKNMLAEGKDYITVAENGGLECSKCHY
tara:strand:+ start:297 stop:1148 length:852 start_codon:yes stop_codon:yes gene_type:complete